MKRVTAFLATVLLAGTVQAAPGQISEPLDPDRAFRPDARLVAGDSSGRHGIDIEYRIAPGYYLYRDRLRFEVVPPTLLVGAPEFPPGTEVDDPFLGKSVIFRDSLVVHLPFAESMARAGRYKVRITAQGCAEDRICYSPFPQEVVVNIPPGYRVTDSPPAVHSPSR
jgi:thiol:disulfide interchange protein DsbD